MVRGWSGLGKKINNLGLGNKKPTWSGLGKDDTISKSDVTHVMLT